MTETCPRPPPSDPPARMVKMLTDHTFTTSRSFGLSWRYLTIHVMTLAVVSWAANSTPIMLSAIWSSLKVSPLSSLEFNRQPKRSLSSNFFSFLSQIITLRILVSLFLACRVPNKTEKERRQSIGMSLLPILLRTYSQIKRTRIFCYILGCESTYVPDNLKYVTHRNSKSLIT